MRSIPHAATDRKLVLTKKWLNTEVPLGTYVKAGLYPQTQY